ncbi:iron ABC transporter permease, partial [bacterium]|nr:iron ABC transporter permease [bacterium]
MRPSRIFSVSIFLLLVVFVAAHFFGDLDWRLALESPQLLWELRGARALLAIAVGGSLALAGALLQVLFSNPICEPYTL